MNTPKTTAQTVKSDKRSYEELVEGCILVAYITISIDSDNTAF